jgi:tetratricopeptide (TPR) repeat protein
MVSKEKLEMLKYYEKGLELYRGKNFEEAKKYFNKCVELVPDDGPAKIYIDRCQEFIKSPPPENWDGVFVMTSK